MATTFATVIDANGVELAEGDIVTLPCGCREACTFRVREVDPGAVGLVWVAAHGLAHCPNVRGLQAATGGQVTRVAEAAPVLAHRDGLVAFG
jgi:hypothetical protein